MAGSIATGATCRGSDWSREGRVGWENEGVE